MRRLQVSHGIQTRAAEGIQGWAVGKHVAILHQWAIAGLAAGRERTLASKLELCSG
jgi:hypothetical protein